VTGDELARRLDKGTVALLDVRSREEFIGEAGYPCDPRQGHIPGAVHLEWSHLVGIESEEARQLLAERGIDLGKEIVAYCHSGSRSEVAAAALRAAGLEATNYEGSWHEWSRREPLDRKAPS
jgi:thiosulfate/3-mercaptopyruvate sulfurtransferase